MKEQTLIAHVGSVAVGHHGASARGLARSKLKIRCQNSSALARGGRRRGVQLWDGQRPTDGHLDGQLAP